jgi:hypothetical protein
VLVVLVVVEAHNSIEHQAVLAVEAWEALLIPLERMEESTLVVVVVVVLHNRLDLMHTLVALVALA